MNDSLLDRRSTMSWPSVLVILLASWGILRTSSPMISQRPRVETEQLPSTTGAQNIPARLWQDPLALAYQLERAGDAKYEPPLLADVLGRPDVRQRPVLFLTVLLPSNSYAEGAEQCRQHRYAVVSALGQSHFAPLRSDAIGYVRIPPATTESHDGQSDINSSGQKPLIVPFEWFEREEDSRLIFLHWIDETQLSTTPLAHLANVRSRLEAATRVVPDQQPQPSIRYAVLGPASSTTLKRMQLEKQSLSGSGGLSDTTIYSTQATADSARRVADSDASPRLRHLIGTDEDLAQAIVAELFQLRDVSKKPTVALIAEWDTAYGRNMFTTYRKAIKADPARHETNIQEIKYLRGLDGQLPGASPSKEGDASTDVASGLSQIDYVRRLVVQLKRSANPPQAIGVLGSDVYDKLLLLKALRQEFPTASLFTTDLDDRLLDRREFRSTHNLLIASHYNLSLHESLQKGVPPFRSNYQTSLYFGTLVMLKDQGIIVGKNFDKIDKNLDEAVKNLDWAIRVAERSRQTKHPVLLFEVGRTRAFNLNQIKPHPLHPDGDRQKQFLERHELNALIVGSLMTFIFLFFFRGALQEFVLTACRLELGWRHWLAMLIALAALGSGWLIRHEHYSNPDGEPFALYEGISVWPTNCLRLFLVGFCSYSVLRSKGDMYKSYESVSRIVLGIEPPRKLVKPPPKRLSCREYFGSWRACIAGCRDFALNLQQRFAKNWNYTRMKRLWSWWIANNLSGWNRRLKHPEEPVADRCARNEWRRYGRWSQFKMQHFRVLPHLLVFLAFAIMLFVFLGFATSPARGASSLRFNQVVYTASGVSILWLMFYVLDSIRLCNRWVEQVASGTARWPEPMLRRAAARFATPDNETFHRILGLLLDVQLVARHTEVVARLVYAPCVALLIGFVARHSVFDNWSWSPQVSITFGLLLLITFYSATVLGRSAIRAKRQAVQTVEGIVSSLAWQSADRARAEALLQDIESIDGGAMVSLRRNPLVAAALLPFGSLSSVYLLEFLLEHIGQ